MFWKKRRAAQLWHEAGGSGSMDHLVRRSDMEKLFAKHLFVLLQLMSLFTTINDQQSLFMSSQSRQYAGVNSEPIAAPVVSPSSFAWIKQQAAHKHRPLSTEEEVNIARLSDRQRFLNLLQPIAVPRVSGTPGIQRVSEFIAKTTLQQQLGYTVEYDAFEDAPPEPHAPRTFTNIIATLNPAAPRQLVLACHHDSKYDRREQFIGASDSAVPCAMMLDIAVTLTPLLKDSEMRDAVTLQLIFFDGEEAFMQWSQTDSLYGSRHLAAKWNEDRHLSSAMAGGASKINVNRLKGIDALVLLDLIGPRDVQFQNIFGKTNGNYQRLVKIERDLTVAGEIKQWQDFGGRKGPYFKPGQPVNYNLVDDDHRPFMEKGVPILHLISAPFPQCWHKYCDNLDNVHYETTDDILKILRVFVCEYLHCKP